MVVAAAVVVMMRAIIYVTCLPACKAYSVSFQFCTNVILQVMSARIRASGGHLSQPARLRLPDSCNPRHKLVSLACPMFHFSLPPLRLPRTERIVTTAWKNKSLPLCPFKPLTPELNPSAQRCLTRILLGILLLEPCNSLTCAWKTNKCNNYSFSL
jgi:hypothetical protein